MKRLGLLVCMVLAGGCAYDVPEFYEIGNSDTGFLLPLEGDTAKQAVVSNEDYYKEKMVSVRRIPVPHIWVSTGYAPLSGFYQDTVRVVVVDRAPETRFWTAEKNTGSSQHDQAIWVESQDSVGFSTGVTLTARILTDEDAAKFLFHYPALLETGRPEEVDPLKDAMYSVDLKTVMDSEVFARVSKVMAEFCAQTDMDELRDMKVEMIDAVEEDIVPFFEERGITITTVGQFGGFTYENPDVQTAIDRVFEAQQDQNVAIAEAEAQGQRNEAVRLTAEGKAEALRLEAEGKKDAAIAEAEGEAQAIQTVADARKYELEQLTANPETYIALRRLELVETQLSTWDGRYPTSLMQMGSGSEGGPAVLLELPGLPNPQEDKESDPVAAEQPQQAEPVSLLESQVY